MLVTLSELYAEWSKPPFGIPQGLLPIFGLTLLLAKENALAFFPILYFTPLTDVFASKMPYFSPSASTPTFSE